MKEKLKIGIIPRIENIEKINEKRDAISHDLIKFIEFCNAIPIVIPNVLRNVGEFLNENQIEMCVLSGGDNVGENQERDQTEKLVINYCVNNRIPLFGICRGMQVLNLYFNGKVSENATDKHVRSEHKIKISGKIRSVLRMNILKVRSFHNNIILEEMVGENLKVFALCEEDGTVEGFSHNELPIIGIMWHPERESFFENGKILLEMLVGKK